MPRLATNSQTSYPKNRKTEVISEKPKTFMAVTFTTSAQMSKQKKLKTQNKNQEN